MRGWMIVCVSLVLMAGMASAVEPDAEGFVSIFDGKTLEGWDGNPDFWSVKDGVIHGETTKEKPTRGNTFCIWRGGTLKDFELQLSFRIQNGNSGVQYRSLDLGKWVVSGYQAEVCNQKGKVGFLYHEKGRGYLCNVGEKVVMEDPSQQPAPAPAPKGKKQRGPRTAPNRKVVGKLGDKMELTKTYKDGDWNHYRIVAKGNHLMHFLNGVQTVDFTDNDLDAPDAKKPNLRKGRLEGILALQIHAGPPMVVEFKDIKIKPLEK